MTEIVVETNMFESILFGIGIGSRKYIIKCSRSINRWDTLLFF